MYACMYVCIYIYIYIHTYIYKVNNHKDEEGQHLHVALMMALWPKLVSR